MAGLLGKDGVPVKPSAVLREMGRIGRGIY
jgi:hypothetical protein